MADTSTDTVIGQHGGNMSWLAMHFPEAPKPLLDLSTCVNPYAYPLPAMRAEWNARLGDPAEMQAARAAAAKYYGVTAVALGPGMQPLIAGLAALRLRENGPSGVAVLSPTYGEHALVWEGFGHRVNRVATPEALAGHDVAILANPNNPDGRIVHPEALRALAGRVGWLIVDESFADLVPELGIAGKGENIAVLRSCGKFFGIAGLRVSAAIAPAPWLAWLEVTLGPWPVSTMACNVLPGMLADAAWAEGMRTRLEREAAAWRSVLSRHFAIAGHTALFTLAETADARRWHRHLAAQGILTRIFDYNPRWLRFGLPDAAHLPRIKAALESI